MTKSKTLIMIPAYNAEKFISRSIDSCLKQTLPTEIWVIDNCSTDATQQIVNEYEKKYDRVKLIVNDKNYGRVGNWNRCLELFEKSSFEYLKFLFIGDELLPECIERVEEVLDKHNNLSIVIWPYIFRELDGKTRIVRKFHNNERLSREKLIKMRKFPFGDGVPGAIVCNTYTKQAIRDIRFNDDYLGLISFSNKLFDRGDLYHIKEPLSVFNRDGHNSFHKQFNYLNVLEIAFTKSLGLESAKATMQKDDYDEIWFNIIKDLIVGLEKSDNKVLDFLEFLVEHRKKQKLK